MDFTNMKSLTIPEGEVKSISINGQVVAVFGETDEPIEEHVEEIVDEPVE